VDKVIAEKIYTAVAGMVVSLVAGVVLRRAWRLVTGSEPPNLADPEVPAKRALTWFLLSTLGAGVATILSKRGALKFATGVLEHAESA
jgi:hypothetical protein